VAQLVEHHLAKVRVAGSNPVVRSEVPDTDSRMRSARLCRHLGRPASWAVAGGGMAEWLRQGPAKPCTRVRFPLPPRGRLAQRESASLTRKRSLVQSQYRPRCSRRSKASSQTLGLALLIICPRLVRRDRHHLAPSGGVIREHLNVPKNSDADEYSGAVVALG
jgi:hypothetical protein